MLCKRFGIVGIANAHLRATFLAQVVTDFVSGANSPSLVTSCPPLPGLVRDVSALRTLVARKR
jgi:hypothetical protein